VIENQQRFANRIHYGLGEQSGLFNQTAQAKAV
jgi:hypothetical protein